MSILSDSERKTPQGRLVLFCIYALLFAGALGMVYPFLLMVRMTTADTIDRDSLSPLPAYFWNHDQFARKYLSQQYMLVPGWIVAHAYGTRTWTSLAQAQDFHDQALARFAALPNRQLTTRVNDFFEFAAASDPRFLLPGLRYDRSSSLFDRYIISYLAERDDVPIDTHRFFEPVRPDFIRRDWSPPSGEAWKEWQEWLEQLPGRDRFVMAPSWIWQRFLAAKYEENLDALRAAHHRDYSGFAEGPRFSVRQPTDSPALAADWKEFVAERYPLFWQTLTPETAAAMSERWVKWLGDVPGVPDAQTWTRITGLPPEAGFYQLPAGMPPDETAASWWCRFVADFVPIEGRILASSEEDFARFLQEKYKTLDALELAWGKTFSSWENITFPVPEADFLTLTTNRPGILWMLSTQNFRIVTRALLTEGPAFFNTFLIVILSVLTSLTVNPLAAYALSRFRMRGSYQILLFLLATMALPMEAALVPGFLLVRDLQLTDTFWALVLPTAANAFSIFLLKGFFDSLPRELYESARIDGAGEFALFTKITLPLSLPILAVILLFTVTAAYHLFMPAVLYLGDTNKWPVSVKIYEINQTWPPGVGMAALVLSSIFPLLVFVFCQRIIMRGIILPSMK